MVRQIQALFPQLVDVLPGMPEPSKETLGTQS